MIIYIIYVDICLLNFLHLFTYTELQVTHLRHTKTKKNHIDLCFVYHQIYSL